MYVHLPYLLQATRCEQLQVPEVPASGPLHLPVHRQTEVPTETLQDTDVEETEASAAENVREGANVCFTSACVDKDLTGKEMQHPARSYVHT